MPAPAKPPPGRKEAGKFPVFPRAASEEEADPRPRYVRLGRAASRRAGQRQGSERGNRSPESRVCQPWVPLRDNREGEAFGRARLLPSRLLDQTRLGRSLALPNASP